MKTADRRAWTKKAQSIIDEWTPRLGLEGWYISIGWQETDSEVGAAVRWSDGYRNAVLLLNENAGQWWWRPESFRHAIVHELTHLVCQPIGDYINENMREYGAIGREMGRRMETVVDTFSNLIYRAYQRKTRARR